MRILNSCYQVSILCNKYYGLPLTVSAAMDEELFSLLQKDSRHLRSDEGDAAQSHEVALKINRIEAFIKNTTTYVIYEFRFLKYIQSIEQRHLRETGEVKLLAYRIQGKKYKDNKNMYKISAPSLCFSAVKPEAQKLFRPNRVFHCPWQNTFCHGKIRTLAGHRHQFDCSSICSCREYSSTPLRQAWFKARSMPFNAVSFLSSELTLSNGEETVFVFTIP